MRSPPLSKFLAIKIPNEVRAQYGGHLLGPNFEPSQPSLNFDDSTRPSLDGLAAAAPERCTYNWMPFAAILQAHLSAVTYLTPRGARNARFLPDPPSKSCLRD